MDPASPEYVASPRDWVREHVELYESSGGTKGTTLRDTGMPCVIVTCIGAKTGSVRKVPLIRVEKDGVYVAVASQGGAPTHPFWYYNLVANPYVTLQDGPSRSERTARLVEGKERALWWARSVAVFPSYADYQSKTHRKIPVFLLERPA